MADGKFSTDCLFRTAALILQGCPPEEYIKVHGNNEQRITVVMNWNNINEETLRKLNEGKLLVNPLEFKRVFLTEKAKVFKIIDEK